MIVFVTAKQKRTDHTLTTNTEKASERLELHFETHHHHHDVPEGLDVFPVP